MSVGRRTVRQIIAFEKPCIRFDNNNNKKKKQTDITRMARFGKVFRVYFTRNIGKSTPARIEKFDISIFDENNDV